MREYSIGLDLGGTNLRAARFSPEDGLGEARTVATRVNMGPDAVMEDILELVGQVRAEAGPHQRLRGVCLAAPGPLELPVGRFHQPPNLAGWHGFAMRDVLQPRLDVPLYLENDANAAALAEYHLGAGREAKPRIFCMLTLGTGVGNGLVMEGRIFDGVRGLAGEAGHITVDPAGALCGCGNVGCLETLASATSVVVRAERLLTEGRAPRLRTLVENRGLSAALVSKAAEEGDADARELFAETGRALGMAMAAIVNILDPEMIAVAGGMSAAWPLFSPSMLEELRRRSYVFRLAEDATAFERPCRVLRAELGADAGLLGAGLLVFLER